MTGQGWFKGCLFSGLAAQTERLESLLAAFDDHTGDVRMMKRHFGRTSSGGGLYGDGEYEQEDSPLLNMNPGPIPSGPSPYDTTKRESYVMNIVTEAGSYGPSLHTTDDAVCLYSFFFFSFSFFFL